MIVFLDANALNQDPMCSGAVWHVLAHAPTEWDLRLMTSEIAVAEAVASYYRRIDNELVKIGKATSALGSLGAAAEITALVSALQRRRAGYREHLESSLVAAKVEVVSAPDVSHMTVVARSVTRRRPCDDKGDGYRDTLIWITLLEIARANAEDEVVLVTKDGDFLDDERSSLHPHLVEDLEAISASDRVRVSTVLADAALELADRSSEASDMRALKADLKDDTVRSFVESITCRLQDRKLDPRNCALPRDSRANYLQGLGKMVDFGHEIKGGLDEDQAVAQFRFESECHIVVAMPENASLSSYRAMLPMPGGPSIYVITKPLAFSGIVRLGRYDRPIDGEITRISSLDDDPGRREWRSNAFKGLNTDLVGEAFKGLNTDLVGEAFKGLNTDLVGEAFKNLNTDLVGEAFKNLNTDAPEGEQVDGAIDPADAHYRGAANESDRTDSTGSDESDGEEPPEE